MKLRIKSKSTRYAFIAFAAATLLPLTGFAKSKPIMTTDILQHLRKGEPWDRGVFTATKMVMFQQEPTAGTDATSVAKITLSYFTSPDCSETNGTSVPTYTTPDGTSFTINTNTPFGMVAASAWNVGNSKVSPAVADMTQIQSIAVTLKSTNSNTPQANFSGNSFSCINVTCTAGPSGQCTLASGSGTQGFTLKTTAAVGDPADGGVIACMNGGLNNLVTPTADNSTGIEWGGSGTTTGATSITDGATNTTTIVRALSADSSYAAITCSTYSANGGFTSGWFLPAGNNLTTGQLNCLFTNRAQIGGFTNDKYWSSTQASATDAWYQVFFNGTQNNEFKGDGLHVRCARAFTP